MLYLNLKVLFNISFVKLNLTLTSVVFESEVNIDNKKYMLDLTLTSVVFEFMHTLLLSAFLSDLTLTSVVFEF